MNTLRAGKLKRKDIAGMLLLEVMLALMIFSVAAVSLVVALDAALDAFMDIRQESQIRITLQSALAEAKGQNLVVGRGDLKDISTKEISYFREVRALARKNEKNEPVNGLYEVIVQAKWQEKNQSMERQAHEYVYQAQPGGTF